MITEDVHEGTVERVFVTTAALRFLQNYLRSLRDKEK
jgi:hypothetical protein